MLADGLLLADFASRWIPIAIRCLENLTKPNIQISQGEIRWKRLRTQLRQHRAGQLRVSNGKRIAVVMNLSKPLLHRLILVAFVVR